jgi:peroxiredoxin Q/BCP
MSFFSKMLKSLAAFTLVVGSKQALALPKVGQTAPEFTLLSQEGSKVSLKDYRGRWVVLYFYPKDMTPGCTIQAHNFQSDSAHYEALNAVVLGVSVDNVDSHREFCTKEGLSFKLLADTSATVSKSYGSLMKFMGMSMSERNTFLIDPKGKIAKVYPKVSVSKHSDAVLADLKSLQAR